MKNIVEDIKYELDRDGYGGLYHPDREDGLDYLITRLVPDELGRSHVAYTRHIIPIFNLRHATIPSQIKEDWRKRNEEYSSENYEEIR